MLVCKRRPIPLDVALQPEDAVLDAAVRHLQPLERCAVEAAGDDGAIRVQFDAGGVPAVAEGQAVALYEGEVCLGAGIIVAPERDALRASQLTAWARASVATTA